MGRLFLRAFFILISIILALFFPIFLEGNAHYDMNRKKLGFCIYAFGVIKLIGGYIGVYTGGIALHIGKKKAILMPYNKINSARKRFSFIKTFRFLSLKQTVETGAEYMFVCTLAQTLIKALYFIKGGNIDTFKSNLWLNDGDMLRVSIRVVAYFNLFILCKNFLIFLKEKAVILWQKNKKKSTI